MTNLAAATANICSRHGHDWEEVGRDQVAIGFLKSLWIKLSHPFRLCHCSSAILPSIPMKKRLVKITEKCHWCPATQKYIALEFKCRRRKCDHQKTIPLKEN